MPWYRAILLPFSAIWWLVLRVRHLMFDLGVLSSGVGAIKTVVIGNLELGGTGKSQLTIWLIQLLSSEKKIAVLSRGYGRSTSGFLLVDENSNAQDVGDEPLMFKRRYPQTVVAVCEDRLAGIEAIAQKHPEVDLVILDDAFQHRKLQPDFTILTTTYAKPFFKNMLVPAGSLRDIKSRSKYANTLVVTGSPNSVSNEQNWIKSSSFNTEDVFFSTSNTDSPIQIKQSNAECTQMTWLLSGIANADRFENTVSQRFSVQGHTALGDHHRFTDKDLVDVRRNLDRFDPSEISVLITEKDAARTDDELLNTAFHPYKVFYLPLHMKMPAQDALRNKILKHVFGEDQGNV